jgi:hypothetical protein
VRALLACLLAAAPSLATAAPDRALEVAAGPPVRSHRPRAATAPPPALVGWHLTRDADTGVVSELWGGTVAAPGAIADPARAEAAARAFVGAHLERLAPGSRASDLIVLSNTRDGALRSVGLAQRAGGLPVIGGAIGVTFAHDRLVAVTSTALPYVVVSASPAGVAGPTNPAAARRWLAAAGHDAYLVGRGPRAILPLIRGPRDITYHLVDALELAATAGHERWTVYVAPDGTPLARASLLAHATGTLAFDVPVRWPAARQAYPATACAVTVDGAAATTDATGALTWPTAVAASVAPTTSGPVVHVHDATGATLSAALALAPGATTTWSLAATATADAQLTAFIHTGLAKDRARRINPAIAAWLDQPLDVSVNETGACNASSDQLGLYFDLGDAACENTGRIADVIYHEFGHSLHRASMLPGLGAFDVAMSEGLADFNAANLTGDPGFARGLTFDATPLRDLDPPGVERRWPRDINSDVHVTGLILGGALWDLRKRLIADLGQAAGVAAAERVFRGVLERAADIPGAYLAAQIADDDDGDLSNGTPHLCAIHHGFAPHGLAPDYPQTTIGSPTGDGPTITVPVTEPDVPGCQPVKVAAIAVDWQDGPEGGHLPLPRTAGAPAAAFTGTLPPLPDDTVVTYQVVVTYDDGTTERRPDNPADPRYQRYLGPVTTLWCDRFDAEPTSWHSAGVLGPEWQWATPTTTSADDPAAAFTGSHVYGTDVGPIDTYQNNQDSQATTPSVDVRGYHEVRLQYRRWLTVQDAAHDQATIEVDHAPRWTNATAADHLDREWRLHDLDLSSTLPRDWLTVTWRLKSDAAFTHGGWTLDDVCLVAVGPRDPLPCGSPGADACPAPSGLCAAGGDPRGLVPGLLVAALAITRRRRGVSSRS